MGLGNLGESPLALAIGHLRELAETSNPPETLATWEALADYYTTIGWKADRSVLHALNAARSTAATKAVTAAIQGGLSPLARKVFHTHSVAGKYISRHWAATCRTLPVEEGTVYLFADGLRMDLARGLEERLLTSGLSVEIEFSFCWSAFPPLQQPRNQPGCRWPEKLGGPLEGTGFQSKEQGTGKALVHARFKQLLAELGISFLEPNELGSPTGCAWTEFGSVDTYGHEQGAKLAWRVEEELDRVAATHR